MTDFRPILQKSLLTATAGLLIATLWYLLKYGFGLHDFVLPAPHHVAMALFRESKAILNAALVTVFSASAGFSAALSLGFIVGLILASFPKVRYALYPYVLFLQMSPILATAAIVVIFFDVGVQSVAIIAFLIGFFPVVASTVQGMKSTPKAQIELFRLYGASFAQEISLLRIPYSLPYVFTGAKIAATLAVIGAVTGEIFASSSTRAGGLGFLILTYKAELKIDALYATTFVCCLLGTIFVGAVLLMRYLSLRKWHESARKDSLE